METEYMNQPVILDEGESFNPARWVMYLTLLSFLLYGGSLWLDLTREEKELVKATKAAEDAIWAPGRLGYKKPYTATTSDGIVVTTGEVLCITNGEGEAITIDVVDHGTITIGDE